MGTQYGPYVMYILSQLLQKKQAMEQAQKTGENSQDQKSSPVGDSGTLENAGASSGVSKSALSMLGALSSVLPKAASSGSLLNEKAMTAMSALSGLSQVPEMSGLSKTFDEPNRSDEPNTSETPEIITIENDFFARDETGAIWHRESRIELLQSFCREGVAQAKRHGHFIIGTRGDANFIGIPGRFLIEEQPAGGKTGFTLWQPLKGGEEHYDNLEDIDEETAVAVYGYWIAELDGKTLQIREA